MSRLPQNTRFALLKPGNVVMNENLGKTVTFSCLSPKCKTSGIWTQITPVFLCFLSKSRSSITIYSFFSFLTSRFWFYFPSFGDIPKPRTQNQLCPPVLPACGAAGTQRKHSWTDVIFLHLDKLRHSSIEVNYARKWDTYSVCQSD